MQKRSNPRRKKLAVWLLVVATIFAVTACGGKNQDNSNTGAAASSPAVESAASSEPSAVEPAAPVEITIWDLPKADDAYKPFKEKMYADFEKQYPNIKVTHLAEPEGTNDREVFVTSMAGGSGPDAYSSAHFPIIADWVEQGLALDLTSYWNEYADKDQFIPSAMEAATIDGKVYGVPSFMYTTGLLYNKKLFTAAGLDPNKPPATWDELVEYGKKLTDPSKNQYGLTLLGMEWADWWFEYYVWQAGGDLTSQNPDKTATLHFTEEPAVTALQFYKDLKWKNKIVQKNVLQNYDENLNDLYQGRAAMTNGASADFGGYASNGLDLNNLGFAPYPSGPSGQQAPSQVGGDYWIINPKTTKEKQDAAWAYIKFTMSKEYLEQQLKFEADNGLFPNLLSVRKDIDPSQSLTNVPQDLVAGVRKAAEVTHLEYFLKERLSPYVVKAVQKALIDEKSDPKALLQAAQDAAQKEVIDPYNASVKK